MTTTLAFIDTETTGLGPDRQTWEVGYLLRRDPDALADSPRSMFLRVDLAAADPAALAIGRYYDRHPDPYPVIDPHYSEALWDPATAAEQLARDLRGATLVAANPAFDAENLRRILAAAGLIPTWHHRLYDVQAAAAGLFGWETPRSLAETAEEVGVIPHTAHEALADAMTVRDVYDVIRAWPR